MYCVPLTDHLFFCEPAATSAPAGLAAQIGRHGGAGRSLLASTTTVSAAATATTTTKDVPITTTTFVLSPETSSKEGKVDVTPLDSNGDPLTPITITASTPGVINGTIGGVAIGSAKALLPSQVPNDSAWSTDNGGLHNWAICNAEYHGPLTTKVSKDDTTGKVWEIAQTRVSANTPSNASICSTDYYNVSQVVTISLTSSSPSSGSLCVTFQLSDSCPSASPSSTTRVVVPLKP
jgi:hypothetical protein